MAERLADVVAQIQNVRQLESVVTAMRGIAASRARQGRSLLTGIGAHTRVISAAIGQALSLMPSDEPTPARSRHSRRGLIVFCAEQGFAGAFSERILDAVKSDLAGAAIFLIGTRGAALPQRAASSRPGPRRWRPVRGQFPFSQTGSLTRSTGA